jgi:O-antigen/teichoic acid export membrane protein
MRAMNIKGLISGLTPSGTMAKGVTAIAMGSGVSQVITLLAAPILTRLYSPADYGVLAVYTGILGLVIVIASLRYQLAIVLPRTDGSAASILVLALSVLFFNVVLAAIAVAFLGPSIGAWTNAPQLTPYLWLLPVGIALAGSYQIFNYWAIRKGEFKIIARTKIQQSASMAATQVFFGLVNAAPVGLLIGQIFGQAGGLLRLVRSAWSEDRHLLARINTRRILQRARRYRDFPIYLTLGGLMNSAGAQLPLILFSALFSPAIAGLYLLAFRVINRPAGVLSQAIRQVFLSGAGGASRGGRLGSLSCRAYAGLTRIGFAPIVFVGVIAPELFHVLFGPEWAVAGTYVQWMVPWLATSFVASPLTTLNVVLERQRFGLAFQTVLLSAKLGGIILGNFIGGPLTTVACYSIAAAICYLGFGLWISAAAGAPLRSLLKAIGVELCAVLPFAIFLVATKPDGWLDGDQQSGLSPVIWLLLFFTISISVVLWRSFTHIYRQTAMARRAA